MTVYGYVWLFLNVSLGKASPEVLPYSNRLLAGAGMAMLLSLMVLWMVPPRQLPFDHALSLSVLTVPFMPATLWALLLVSNKLARFQKLATAWLGCRAVIHLALILLGPLSSALSEHLFFAVELAGSLWQWWLIAMILRFGLDMRLGLSLLLALMVDFMANLPALSYAINQDVFSLMQESVR